MEYRYHVRAAENYDAHRPSLRYEQRYRRMGHYDMWRTHDANDFFRKEEPAPA